MGWKPIHPARIAAARRDAAGAAGAPGAPSGRRDRHSLLRRRCVAAAIAAAGDGAAAGAAVPRDSGWTTAVVFETAADATVDFHSAVDTACEGGAFCRSGEGAAVPGSGRGSCRVAGTFVDAFANAVAIGKRCRAMGAASSLAPGVASALPFPPALSPPPMFLTRRTRRGSS